MYDGQKMSSKGLTRELIVGSKAIDRMREEISSIVSMVVGMVSSRYVTEWRTLVKGPDIIAFNSSECEWKIHILKNQCLSVYCGLINSPIDYVVYFYMTTPPHGTTTIKLQYVKKVHDALPVFIEGMVKTFPFLTERWQPVLDAADYAEKNGW